MKYKWQLRNSSYWHVLYGLQLCATFESYVTLYWFSSELDESQGSTDEGEKRSHHGSGIIPPK